jgi:hypothetical protein
MTFKTQSPESANLMPENKKRYSTQILQLALRLIPFIVLVFLSFKARTVYLASDDGQYLKWARCIAESLPPPLELLDQEIVRLTIWLPIGLLARCGIDFQVAVSLIGYLWGSMIILGLHSLGKGNHSAFEKHISAFLVATSSLVVSYVGLPYPGIPLAACLVMAFATFRRKISDQNTLPWIVIGIWIGLGVLAKQTAILALPFIAVPATYNMFKTKQHKKAILKLMLIGAGGGIVLFGQAIFLGYWVGEPLYLFKIQQAIGDMFLELPWYESNMLNRWYYFKILTSRDYLGCGLIIPALTLIGVLFKREYRVEGLFAITMLLYLMFGSVSLTEYVRPTQNHRYLLPYIPFFIVSAVHTAAWMWRSSRRLLPQRLHTPIKYSITAIVISMLALNSYEFTRPMFPVKSQIDMVNMALHEHTEIAASKDWYTRMSPVISTTTLTHLVVIQDEDLMDWILSENDCLVTSGDMVLIADSLSRNQFANEKTLTETGVIYGPPIYWTPSLPRKLLDSLRNKPAHRYYFKPKIYWIHFPPTNQDGATQGNWPPFTKKHGKQIIAPDWLPVFLPNNQKLN